MKESSDLLMNKLLKLLKCLFDGNEMMYVSTPINTGKRYIDWYKKIGRDLKEPVEYRDSMLQFVIEPNTNDAKNYIENLKKEFNKIIIDPTTLESDELQWSQEEFYSFWIAFIKDLINEIVFLDGWEYSLGCCHEFLAALKNKKTIYTQEMKVLSAEDALKKIEISIRMYSEMNMQESNKLTAILNQAQEYCIKDNSYSLLQEDKRKDEKLNILSSNNLANVAQYISFEPNEDLTVKFVHINKYTPTDGVSPKELIEKLINSAESNSVNIRSFSPLVTKGNALVFNKKINDIDEILQILIQNSRMGKFSIVNENISIHDSGVSGVVLGDVIEFSPEDTPKCVDKEAVCSLPKDLGMKILKNVYGFSPDVSFGPNFRVEFSIHPKRQGVKKEHTIIWEYEYFKTFEDDKKISWPNRFSQYIGDKAFGLLVADALGFMVPKTTVISRKLAPFSFGRETGLIETWTRTCPVVKEPGKYYTGKGWTDPFKLIDQEEENGDQEINIASILSQSAVEAVYSGASLIRDDEKDDLVEGVIGEGDKFMVGKQDKGLLPTGVTNAVKTLNSQLRQYHHLLGDISIEWVFDGKTVWIVQLNQLKKLQGKTKVSRMIVGGNPSYYEKVYVKDGLDALRSQIDAVKNKNIGIELIGNVGITSHFGDLLRLSNIPSKVSDDKDFCNY